MKDLGSQTPHTAVVDGDRHHALPAGPLRGTAVTFHQLDSSLGPRKI